MELKKEKKKKNTLHQIPWGYTGWRLMKVLVLNSYLQPYKYY